MTLMQNSSEPRVVKWPFFTGDILLIIAAYLIYHQAKLPLGHWEMLVCSLCIALGAAVACVPFILEYRDAAKKAETLALTSAIEQIQQLGSIAGQIAGATAQWQTVQETSGKTVVAAKEISDLMSAEVKSFSEFLQRANDSEKTNLRLEVEKMKRVEGEWLQVVIRILDHVFALNQGAARSGQPNLIEQLSNFQTACRDAARRVGLTAVVATPNEPFDPRKHQVMDGNGKAPESAVVVESLATGYSFQGRFIRPILVRVQTASAPEQPAEVPQPENPEKAVSMESPELPLGAT